jgi:DNA mismatch endonuclease (patch repair protein)
MERDHRQQRQLREMGWSVMVVWECELRDLTSLTARLAQIGSSGGVIHPDQGES